MISKQDILREADRCVLCGMCLPHCPTYTLSRNENESPRGRISMLRALANESLVMNPAIKDHLDHCVKCRACEQICPSKVDYIEIIDAANQFYTDTPADGSESFSLFTDRQKRQALFTRLRVLQKTGLDTLASPLLSLAGSDKGRQLRMLPSIPAIKPFNEHYPAMQSAKGQVALFTGCLSHDLENETLHAAIRLLNQSGYDVDVPASQDCCGAVFQHSGQYERAQQLMETNLAAFSDKAYDAILTVTSGCGAMLKDYGLHADVNATGMASRIQDVSDFIMKLVAGQPPACKPLNKSVALHTPCSLYYPLKQADGARKLLTLIPDMSLHYLEPAPRCCGAGGKHMLQDPDHADALLQPTLDMILANDTDILVTSNLGCAMHLRQGLLSRGKHIEILHPLQLFARQLEGL